MVVDQPLFPWMLHYSSIFPCVLSIQALVASSELDARYVGSCFVQTLLLDFVCSFPRRYLWGILLIPMYAINTIDTGATWNCVDLADDPPGIPQGHYSILCA